MREMIHYNHSIPAGVIYNFIVLQEIYEKVVFRRHMNAQRLKCGIQRVQVPQEILGWPHVNAIEAYAKITNIMLSNK